MIDAVTCLAASHNPGLVLLAGLMCVLGAFSTIQLHARGLISAGVSRFGWQLLGAVTLGATVWCTHFIAILAYEPGVGVSFDPVLTIVSLLVPILGALPGLAVAGARGADGPIILPAVGGGIVGGAIAAMHFTGMVAYRAEGIATWWTPGIVLATLSAMLLGAVAFALAAQRGDGKPSLRAVAVFVLAVLSLHFTGMAALTITPLPLSEGRMGHDTFVAMAIAIAIAGLLVLASGLFAHLIDDRARQESVERLTQMALTDLLTGLPNRAAAGEAMHAAIDAARRHGTRLAVIAIDLDRFKDVNDTHGHAAGDEAMRVLARRFAVAAGEHATLARIGGDEFCAVLPFSTRGELDRAITRLEDAAREPVPWQEIALGLGARFGIACFPEDGTTVDQLASNSDLALYRAKAQPLVTHCFFDASMDAAARERRALASALREALGQNALTLHYQMQASVRDGEITGYEALLRWTHPEIGPVSPAVFIPIAEETGLIPQLGAWVLRRACSEAAAWNHPWRVAVNISPLQLADPNLPAMIRNALAESGLAPERLEIELTETAIVEDQERALAILRAIKALGVGVALDDFGTGYSSLKTLRSFPFDKIKLDRFFVSEIESSAEAKAVVRSVVALGKSLDIAVLAEGVERPAQLAILVQEGCDEAQGFLLGRPSPHVAEPPRDGASASRAA
ncbi:putative bifunctional diguanylate cyclase/phosphodiesterase [Elioraea rosea]|uniref:putative bifunctional diguanylate cyclase/phosphodiesterase n=1 Tax=Elioraea rosea TaxID=2492390 RepID=UPI00194FA71D|nr:EAL domain-containing protein [Elioraea rosea]